MPSETTARPDDTYDHIAVVSRYSWGSNMDHSQGWLECRACGDWFNHSDYGDYGSVQADYLFHGAKTCLQARMAQVAGDILAGLFAPKPEPYDEPF